MLWGLFMTHWRRISISRSFSFPVSEIKSLIGTRGIFLSVRDSDKNNILPVAEEFAKLGFELCATSGTAKVLHDAGLKVQTLFKLTEGRPNCLDLIKNGEIAMVINTPAGKTPRADEVKIRTASVQHKIPIMTTLAGANAAVLGIKSLRDKGLTVKPLQDYHGG